MQKQQFSFCSLSSVICFILTSHTDFNTSTSLSFISFYFRPFSFFCRNWLCRDRSNTFQLHKDDEGCRQERFKSPPAFPFFFFWPRWRIDPQSVQTWVKAKTSACPFNSPCTPRFPWQPEAVRAPVSRQPAGFHQCLRCGEVVSFLSIHPSFSLFLCLWCHPKKTEWGLEEEKLQQRFVSFDCKLPHFPC